MNHMLIQYHPILYELHILSIKRESHIHNQCIVEKQQKL